MKKTILMIGAAVVMTMAASACSGSKAQADSLAAQADDYEDIPITELAAQSESVLEDPALGTAVEIKVDTVGYTTTASGLKYKKVSGKATSSRHPGATDNVEVHYTGKHLNGEVFDSSVERGQSITFPLNGVIKGWTEGVQLMSPGETYQFLIPSDLAYGSTGTPGGPIAPNEDLYFEVQLIDIK